jgi:aminocarboxymuconate-semialdehyde decarboxylase
MVIDTHSHYIPESFITLLKEGDSELQAKLVEKEGKTFVSHNQGYVYPLLRGFYDLSYRLEEMDKAKIDIGVLSTAPPMFYYWASTELAAKVARIINDGIKQAVDAYPDRFVGMATVPLQDSEAAIKELHYCVNELGFKSVLIGSNVEGKQYDEPEFLPFFQECAKLGVIVNLHPYYVGDKKMFEKYYLTNLLGNPLDSAVALSHLIFGGVFDNCPGLKICMAHGGGFLPYQIGRLQHGYEVRNEPKVNNCSEPLSYMKQVYFDSILFNQKALKFLVDLVGADRVMMGTDYPFDMGEDNPFEFVNTSDLSGEEKDKILSGNAKDLFSHK